jgi:hypothetical protein
LGHLLHKEKFEGRDPVVVERAQQRNEVLGDDSVARNGTDTADDSEDALENSFAEETVAFGRVREVEKEGSEPGLRRDDAVRMVSSASPRRKARIAGRIVN